MGSLKKEQAANKEAEAPDGYWCSCWPPADGRSEEGKKNQRVIVYKAIAQFP